MNTDYLYYQSKDSMFLELSTKTYFRNIEIKIDFIDNGFIFPINQDFSGCIYDENGFLIKKHCEQRNCLSIPNLDIENFDYIDETVVFIGNFRTQQWGNIFVDFLSRFYYLLDNSINYKIAYLSGNNFTDIPFGSLNKNTFEIFRLLGVTNDRLIEIKNITKFKKLIIPEKSFVPFKFYTKEYLNIYNSIIRKVNNSNSILKIEKIYFTRRKMTRRKEVGEKIFEIFFKINGFTILSPEKLPLVDQINYVNNCDVLASLEGSLAHNILWGNNKTRQIILRKQSEIMPRQFQLNEAKGIPVTYIDVFKEPFRGYPITHDRGPFLIVFNENIKKFAHDNDMQIPKILWILKIGNYLTYFLKCFQMKTIHFISKEIPSLKFFYRKISARIFLRNF